MGNSSSNSYSGKVLGIEDGDRESDLTLVPNFESSLPEIGKIPARKTVMSIKDFGGIGDGETTNTNVFQDAIRHMEQFGSSGVSQLNVPKGRWLTGSFNLTSNFTLFLEDVRFDHGMHKYNQSLNND
ncbi:Probable polygalacturonase [Linum perenne]